MCAMAVLSLVLSLLGAWILTIKPSPHPQFRNAYRPVMNSGLNEKYVCESAVLGGIPSDIFFWIQIYLGPESIILI